MKRKMICPIADKDDCHATYCDHMFEHDERDICTEPPPNKECVCCVPCGEEVKEVKKPLDEQIGELWHDALNDRNGERYNLGYNQALIDAIELVRKFK